MSDHAVRVRAPSGWIDLAYIATGPQGAKGDKGDPGAPGQPVGAAGGDLAGSYPNPTIGAAKVTSGKIADRAVTSRAVLLDSQQIDGFSGTNVAVAAPASGSELGRNLASGTDWRLAYTPPVDCWWDVSYRVEVNKTVAGWAYIFLSLKVLNSAIPATATTPAYAAGSGIGRAITALYGPGGSEYGYVEMRRRVALTAGLPYALQPVLTYAATGWAMLVGGESIPSATGVAWAR